MILRISSLLFILHLLPVRAQESLSVSQAIGIALEQNYQVKIASKRQDIGAMNNNWMEAGAFPSVSVSVGNNNAIQDNTNNPFTFTPGIILSQSINPVLAANWNIFSGFSVFIQKDRLELLEAQSAQNALLLIENTIQDVMVAYYTASLQEERKALMQSVLAISRDRFHYFQLREKYSSASSLELLQFKNQYFTDSMNYLMQDMSLMNAMRNLKLLMNDTSDVAYSLSDSFDYAFAVIDRQQAKEELLANNANIKNQFISMELQERNTALQKSFLYPTLSFQAGVSPSWMWIREIKDDLFEAETNTLSYYGNLNLKYTLFNNWKSKRAVEVSKINEEILTLQKEEMALNLTNSLSNLIDLYELRTQLVALAAENVEYAKKAFELAQKKFELGSINSIELTSFQNNFQNAMIQYQENQFNKLDTYLEIYKMTGKLGLEFKTN